MDITESREAIAFKNYTAWFFFWSEVTKATALSIEMIQLSVVLFLSMMVSCCRSLVSVGLSDKTLLQTSLTHCVSYIKQLYQVSIEIFFHRIPF